MGWTDDIADMVHNRGMGCSRTDDMIQWRNDDWSIYRIYRRLDSSRYDVIITEVTLDQAVEMTLGREECRRVMDSIDPFSMWVCDQCGHPLDTSENFCGGCGRRVKR